MRCHRNTFLLTLGVISTTMTYGQQSHQVHLVGQRCAEDLREVPKEAQVDFLAALTVSAESDKVTASG